MSTEGDAISDTGYAKSRVTFSRSSDIKTLWDVVSKRLTLKWRNLDLPGPACYFFNSKPRNFPAISPIKNCVCNCQHHQQQVRELQQRRQPQRQRQQKTSREATYVAKHSRRRLNGSSENEWLAVQPARRTCSWCLRSLLQPVTVTTAADLPATITVLALQTP